MMSDVRIFLCRDEKKLVRRASREVKRPQQEGKPFIKTLQNDWRSRKEELNS